MHLIIRRLFRIIPATFAITSLSAAEPLEIPLWPQNPPTPAANAPEPEKVDRSGPAPAGFALRKNVSIARLAVFPAAEARRTGAACVVVPGGGFGILADEHEGSEACEWLASQGVTAFLLRHRCPTNQLTEPNSIPVQDTQRAMILVREKAAEFKTDPTRTGLLGFSAGGQVALVASTNGLYFTATPGSPGHRPDYLMLLYPWRIFDTKTGGLRADIHVDLHLPPLFLAQASDDNSSLPQGSTHLYLAALESHAAATAAGLKPGLLPELHLYSTGGHGFGLRKGTTAAPGDWPQRAAVWLQSQGLSKP